MLELNDQSSLTGQAYIAGEWVTAQAQFAVTNPSTYGQIGRVADCKAQDATRAIDGAALAQKDWAQCTALERVDVLVALHHAMIWQKF